MTLSVKPISVPWILRYFWDELLSLLVCVLLDVIEILIPILMIPFTGDLIDLVGTTFSIYFFGWIGAVSLLELIPGLDMLPIFTIVWLIWYAMKRQQAEKTRREKLERWR